MLACCRVVIAEDLPNPFPAKEISVSSLPNGLRLIVRENHAVPVVAMEVVVRSGSAAESDVHGVAHYLEHLCFQGTKHYPGALSPQYALEMAGGMSNAVTSRDCTRYQAQIASDKLDVLVQVLADVILAPTLAEDDCRNERAIILAEIAHEYENPIAVLIEAAYANTYRLFPYKFSPKGTEEDVARITAAEIRAFHDRWYVPNNLSVILVGDITGKQATNLIRAAFLGASAKLPSPPLFTEPQSDSDLREIHLPQNLPDTCQVLAFPATSAGESQALAATLLLKTLLADGPDALLPACWAGAGVNVDKYGIEFVGSRAPGRMLIWAETPPAMAGRLRQATLELLARLGKIPLAAPSLEAAKHRLAAQFLRENATFTQQAATLALYEGSGSGEFACQLMPLLHNVTAEQVRKAAPATPLAWITLGREPKGQD